MTQHSIKLKDSIKILDMLKLKQKRKGKKIKFIKVGLKVAKDSKNIAKEELVIDKEKNRKIHKVEELENGLWIKKHDENVPLKESRKK